MNPSNRFDVLNTFNQISIYSDSPIRQNLTAGGLEIQTTKEGRQYCACVRAVGLNPGEAEQALLDFVFFALVRRNVERTLNAGSREGALDVRLVDTFAEKLIDYFTATGAREKIKGKVRAALGTQGMIHLDGIMNFRLREFGRDVQNFFERLFYEYQVQKQYEDFIALIRDFVETEHPLGAVIHIVLRERSFRLYDGRMRDITQSALRKYKRDVRGHEGSYNDFLISSLLDALPQRIVIHRHPMGAAEMAGGLDARIIETVRAIFAERVEFCPLGACCTMAQARQRIWES